MLSNLAVACLNISNMSCNSIIICERPICTFNLTERWEK